MTGLIVACLIALKMIKNRATQWLWIYNNERPNMTLNGVTPMMKMAAASTSTFNLSY